MKNNEAQWDLEHNEEPIPIGQTSEKPTVENTGRNSPTIGETAVQPKSITALTISKEIQTWGISLTLLGLINIRYFLEDPWGLFLILVGLGAFFFRSTAIFVVSGITMVWSGLEGLFFGEGNNVTFILIRFILSALIFWRFFKYHRVEVRLEQEKANLDRLNPARSARLFPWIGLTLGELSFLGTICWLIWLMIMMSINPSIDVPSSLDFLAVILFYCAILGFAVGLASILCHHPNKSAAIGGIITSIFTIFFSMSFFLLSSINP
jgi:hypothetical protein